MPAEIAAPAIGWGVDQIIGGGGPENAKPVLPKDLQPLRQQNIGLLQYLLGFNQPGMPWSTPQQPAPTPGTGGGGYTPGGAWDPWGIQSGRGMPTYFGGYQPSQIPASQGGPVQRPTGGTPTTGDPRQTGGGTPGLPTGGGGTFGNLSMAPPQMAPPTPSPGFPQMAPPTPSPGMQAFGGTANSTQFGNTTAGQAPSGLPGLAGTVGQAAGAAQNPLSRIESFFGPLGTPTTPLQQQSLGGISQFLSSNPYGQSNDALQHILGGSGFNEANQAFRQAGQQNFFGGASNVFNDLATFNPFGAAQGSLEGILGANPGQGMLEALRPVFERNLAAAKQEGGRFGSANAIRESRALDDFNLLGAQALQRGVDQQINAANQLGMIGNSLIGARGAAGQGLLGVGQGQLGQALGSAQGLSGNANALMQGQLGAAGQLSQNQNNMFNALQGAYGTGSAQAQQEAQRQQQALQILQNLLGASFGATLGVPSAYGPSGPGFSQLGGLVAPYLGGGGGGSQGMIPPNYQPGGSGWGGFGIPYGF